MHLDKLACILTKWLWKQIEEIEEVYELRSEYNHVCSYRIFVKTDCIGTAASAAYKHLKKTDTYLIYQHADHDKFWDAN